MWDSPGEQGQSDRTHKGDTQGTVTAANAAQRLNNREVTGRAQPPTCDYYGLPERTASAPDTWSNGTKSVFWMLPDVFVRGGKLRQQRVCVSRNRPCNEIGNTLGFSLEACTLGTSYVTHTACILCIIHHIHELAPKLASLAKSNAHLLMWKMHVTQTHTPELSVSVYSCLHCLY